MILDRELSLKEFIGVSVTLLIVIASAWLNMKVRVAKIEVKVLEIENKLETEHKETYEFLMEFRADNKELLKSINEIKIELQNKQPRK